MTPLLRGKRAPRRKQARNVAHQQTHSGFSGLGIAPGLLAAIDELGFTEPTPIQQQSIPLGLTGEDLIAIAQTGTGKTLAFGVPMLQRLAQIKGRGLIILPTRELAIQVDEALLDVGSKSGLKTAVLIGGASMSAQCRALERKPRIIVATPGRLIDHMQQGNAKLRDVEILVLDEADRMLDMGFLPQINRILEVLPRQRQTMLFSATMPTDIVKIARRSMKKPVHVEIAPSGTTVENVTQEVFFVEALDKPGLLDVQLQKYSGPALVFTRTKHGARKLARFLRARKYRVADIHSDKTLPQRRKALDGFKSGQYRVLVATDIAARGIDVIGIELVANYDLPSTSEDYVHRIGRTARAGRAGRAISFATFNQAGEVRAIEELMRTDLPVTPLPSQFKPPPVMKIPTGKATSGFGKRRSGTRLGTRGRKRVRNR